MINKDDFKKKIYEKLKKVPDEFCAAFAARTAMRVLPLMAIHGLDKEPFWYWEHKDKPKYLIAIMMAHQLSVSFSILNFKNFDINKFSSNAALSAVKAVSDAARANGTYAEGITSRLAPMHIGMFEEYTSAAEETIRTVSSAPTSAGTAPAIFPKYIEAQVVRSVSESTAHTAFYTAERAGAAINAINVGRIFIEGKGRTMLSEEDKTARNDTLAKANKEDRIRVLIYSAILNDLNVIANRSKTSIFKRLLKSGRREVSLRALEFMQAPLWRDKEFPKELMPFWNCFCIWVRELDSGFDFWIDWYLDRVAGIKMDMELLKKQIELPAEIKAQGHKAVNAYLAMLANRNELKNLNIVRAIFIGNGGAGKTSLVRLLYNEEVVEGKEEMTSGIDIRTWNVGETAIDARFWDFGGQVMAHATHQFFLRERCLYIIVLDARTEINANEQAEYWLEHVKAFGKDAPVMAVGNKSDLAQVNIDMQALKENYPNIVGFYSISCTNKTERFRRLFDNFLADFIQQLQRVGNGQVSFTDKQFAVLEELRKRSPRNAFLPHSEFERLCEENGVGNKAEMSRKDFLGVLDKLGEVIHFPLIARLDSYVLNPRWLTYGVYTLIYSEELNKKNGKISEADAIKILSSETVKDERGNVLEYPKDKCEFIIDAMEEFRLCYRLPEDRSLFVIPDKLPAKQPKLKFDKTMDGTLCFEFVFRGFLPRHVMPTLIVSRHEEIKDEMVWQNGVVIYNRSHDATACLQVDYHKRTLSIWVQGAGAREVIAILNDEVAQILRRMENLEHEERVVLPMAARIDDSYEYEGVIGVETVSYKRLMKSARVGEVKILSDNGEWYDLNKVLGTFLSGEQRKKERVGDHYTFNAPVENVYSHFSGGVMVNKIEIRETADKLDEGLNGLLGKIMEYKCDTKRKISACQEITEICSLLKNIDMARPEERSMLKVLLSKVKDGGLGFISFTKKIKDNEDTLGWVLKNATQLLSLLGG